MRSSRSWFHKFAPVAETSFTFSGSGSVFYQLISYCRFLKDLLGLCTIVTYELSSAF